MTVSMSASSSESETEENEFGNEASFLSRARASTMAAPTTKDEGASYIGRRVGKYFANELYFGTVVSHHTADETEDGVALWGVYYPTDGDAEDVEWAELNECLALYETNRAYDADATERTKKLPTVTCSRVKKKPARSVTRSDDERRRRQVVIDLLSSSSSEDDEESFHTAEQDEVSVGSNADKKLPAKETAKAAADKEASVGKTLQLESDSARKPSAEDDSPLETKSVRPKVIDLLSDNSHDTAALETKEQPLVGGSVAATAKQDLSKTKSEAPSPLAPTASMKLESKEPSVLDQATEEKKRSVETKVVEEKKRSAEPKATQNENVASTSLKEEPSPLSGSAARQRENLYGADDSSSETESEEQVVPARPIARKKNLSQKKLLNDKAAACAHDETKRSAENTSSSETKSEEQVVPAQPAARKKRPAEMVGKQLASMPLVGSAHEQKTLVQHPKSLPLAGSVHERTAAEGSSSSETESEEQAPAPAARKKRPAEKELLKNDKASATAAEKESPSVLDKESTRQQKKRAAAEDSSSETESEEQAVLARPPARKKRPTKKVVLELESDLSVQGKAEAETPSEAEDEASVVLVKTVAGKKRSAAHESLDGDDEEVESKPAPPAKRRGKYDKEAESKPVPSTKYDMSWLHNDDSSISSETEEPSKVHAGTAPRKKRLAEKELVDSSEEDSVQEEEERKKRLSGIKNDRIRSLERQAWGKYGDEEFSTTTSDEEDSDDESLLADPSPKKTRRTKRSVEVVGLPEPPQALTPDEIQDMLEKIEKREDKALQKLLFDADFQFELLPHQFLAVRKVAGVPSMFPLHTGSRVGTPTTARMKQAVTGLDSDENKCKTNGMLLADDMGLGKTVEAIAGAVLRNALAAATGKKEKPTCIISPNHNVQKQWHQTLIKNGVPYEGIQMFQKGQRSKDFDKAIFVLMTRYTLQTEMRRVFKNLDEGNTVGAVSVLFPHADISLLRHLKLQYEDENTKKRVNNYIRNKGGNGRRAETVPEVVTRLVRNCIRRQRKQGLEPIFETVIIDEAHFLKNVTAYWGIAAALLGTHAIRTAALTGTPYNNGPSDMATLMTFIDANKHSANRNWWASATSDRAGSMIRDKIKVWHEEYLVRRQKQDIRSDLVPKVVASQVVSQYVAEQSVYEHYEGMLGKILKQFSQLSHDNAGNPAVRERLKNLFLILMALMSNMRSANIHAMLPGGREYTKRFSPSRRHLIGMEEHSKSCVCCEQGMRPSIPVPGKGDNEDGVGNGRNRRRNGANIDELEEGVNNGDDDDDLIGEEEEEELVPLPCSLCDAQPNMYRVKHFVHERCLAELKRTGGTCPRCIHAKKTMNCQLPNGKRFCQKIGGGFVASSKINAVVDWYRKVPDDDKVLILSFFKGGLDLLEGIFVNDMGINVARLDGDIDPKTSEAELDRFKDELDCKILLATVQSGGVGLNITEANHVAFLDRWYNPFVHQQAEDRVHRIGQKKTCKIVYFDCGSTIDEAMVQMNIRKTENSAILLADGSNLGNRASLSYKELSGMLGNLLNAIRSFRTGWLVESPENKNLPIPRTPADVIAAAMLGQDIARSNKKPRTDSSAEGGDSGEEKKPAALLTNGIEDVSDVGSLADFIVEDDKDDLMED